MYRCNNCPLQHISGPASMCNTYICLGITWIYCSTLLGSCLSVKKPFAIGVLCSSFLNHPALLQWHVITSGQVPRWYKSPLQHTSEQISIPGPVPTIQQSFAAHFWANFHTWASAHDTRGLCSSLLDRCPYGGTRQASAHITRILYSSFLDWCP